MAGAVVCLALASAGHAAESAGERVEIASLDRDGTESIRLPGFWFQAPVDGPRPAIVLLHGCGGPYSRCRAAETGMQGMQCVGHRRDPASKRRFS